MRRESKYGDFNKSKVAQTYTEDWAGPDAQPMNQQDNGSMNYKNRKDALTSSDASKIRSSMLPQQ